MQLTRCGLLSDWRLAAQQHGAGIQPLVHAHDRHAALGVPSQYRALNWRGAAPSRQQGGVNIDAAVGGDIQHFLRKDQAVGHHHYAVRCQRTQLGNGVVIAPQLCRFE